MGGRSRAAAKILEGKGFSTVYNLAGGIKAWQGHTAEGPVDMGDARVRGDETPEEIIVIAYGLENGLAQFYTDLAETEKDPDLTDLFHQLATIEEKHKADLFQLYRTLYPETSDRESFEHDTVSTAMEGGFTTEEFLDKNRRALDTVAGTLSVAMALEAQGWDLYMRYAQKSTDARTREILYRLSDEEKAHLKRLGALLDTKDIDF